MSDQKQPNPARRGRGALTRRDSRFNRLHHEAVDDGWEIQECATLRTTVQMETARQIISQNRSPDLPFDRSINPYQGCEHGCIYCYARPSHAYLGLSPGLDFESRLFAKPNAASLLRRELRKKSYRPSPIALGANTDPYQPVEKTLEITRQILTVLLDHRHPVTVTTKSALIERDLDLLVRLASDRLVQVQISITTLDGDLARIMEPRAASPRRRLSTLQQLSQAGIPTTLLMSPIIPVLNDGEIEELLKEAAAAGATGAGYNLLRLPLEVEALFTEWLQLHFPLRAQAVLNRLREAHDGDLYRSEFGIRQTGTGDYARMIQQRFRLSARRNRLAEPSPDLDSGLFRIREDDRQLDLFEDEPMS